MSNLWFHYCPLECHLWHKTLETAFWDLSLILMQPRLCKVGVMWKRRTCEVLWEAFWLIPLNQWISGFAFSLIKTKLLAYNQYLFLTNTIHLSSFLFYPLIFIFFLISFSFSSCFLIQGLDSTRASVCDWLLKERKENKRKKNMFNVQVWPA